jgi:hypothetical protein
MKTSRILIALLILSLFISFASVNYVLAPAITKFKVNPSNSTGRQGMTFSVNVNVYDADKNYNTEVYSWQVLMRWTASVLSMDTLVSWGDFLDGPRVGSWGLLTANAAAGQPYVNVQDGSKYQSGYTVVVKDDAHSETKTVSEVAGSQLTLTTNLLYTYTMAANGGCYPDPATTPAAAIDNTLGRATLGITTMGPAPGATGNGLLLTVKFLIKTEAESTLEINNLYTYLINDLGETIGDTAGELTKENGYFIKPWKEDVNADGWIDIMDLASVGRDFLRYNGNPPVTRNATNNVPGTGWVTPANAYLPDTAYAVSPITTVEQQYYNYGDFTTGWLGLSKVEVGLKMYRASGNDKIALAVSGDGGSTWSTKIEQVPTATETLYWLDVTGLRPWTLSMLSNTNLRVKINWASVGGSGDVVIYINWIPVRVTPILPQVYSPYTDMNTDGIVNVIDMTYVAIKFGEEYAH